MILEAAMNGTMLPLTAAGETAALVQAFNEGSLGVSFGIAGFLIGYLAGAAYLLSELGIITPATKVAGASSGALLSMALCSGIPADRFISITQQLCDACRQQGNCQGRLGAAVANTIPEILPPDAYQRCRDKAYMSISTGPFPASIKGQQRRPPNIMVTDFSSNADLSAAASASSFIPMWSGGSATTFRGMQAYDGFFSNAQPCPPGVKACIKISSKNPPWNNQQLDTFFRIFSRTAHVGPLRPARLAALPSGARLTQESGTAQTSSSSSGDAQRQPQGSSGGDVAKGLQQAAAIGVDLAPGIFTPTGISAQAWEELLVMPGDEALNKHLWLLGHRDAQIWARATGLEAAAAAKRGSSSSNKAYVQG